MTSNCLLELCSDDLLHLNIALVVHAIQSQQPINR